MLRIDDGTRDWVRRAYACIGSGYGVMDGGLCSMERGLMEVMRDVVGLYEFEGDLVACGNVFALLCIRIYALCGAYGIVLRDDGDFDALDDFREIFGGDGFGERCYYLCRLLCSGEPSKLDDDDTDDCLPVILGSSLSFVYAMCEDMGIDLCKYIEERLCRLESM